MHGRLRSKLSYANVIATLALFVALGGSSYAAVKITGKNVTDSSLTTKDIKNRSLLNRDFKPGQLPAGGQGLSGVKGEQGVRGERGIEGTDGLDGSPGAPGSAKAFAVVSADGGLYDEPNRKNVLRAIKPDAATGLYCLYTPDTPYHTMVSLYGQSETGTVTSFPYSNLTGIHCNGAADPGYNVVVHTYDAAGDPADRAFSIIIN